VASLVIVTAADSACALDIPAAYLLPALPGPAMLTIGDPVPSFDSKRPE
jgi:hypothetical protein